MTAHTLAARRQRSARRLDLTIRIIVALTVAVLAFVSGAISFDHMHMLALAHDQTGWRANAFPISVDGLELVSSLVILAEHREHGKVSSWLPWVALGAGTVASLAANIAVGAPGDLIGRCISGWPAIGLLVTLKLAAGRLSGPVRLDGPVRPARSGLDLLGSGWSGAGPGRSEDDPGWTGAGPCRSGTGPLRSDGVDHRSGQGIDVVSDQTRMELTELVAHARRVRDQVRVEGLRLTRRELAARLRAEGRPVSNDRATALVRALTIETTRPRARDIRLADPPDRVALPADAGSRQRAPQAEAA